MKHSDFRNKVKDSPYFTSAVYGGLTSSPKVLQNQVDKWVRSGRVLKLKRGLYTLSNDDRKVGLSREVIANRLYQPSYISLQYALSYYGLIPEGVYAVSSITTKKTQNFANDFGNFDYKNIKKNAFTGFVSREDEFNYKFLIALPEKALLDYLYLTVNADEKVGDDFFELSLRLQNFESLDVQRIGNIAKDMKSKKMLKFAAALILWIRGNK